MLTRWTGVVLAAGVMVAGMAPAIAQSALDGPLAAPDAPLAAPQTPPAHPKAKSHKSHRAAAKEAKIPGAASEAAVPRPTSAEAPAGAAAPADPLDLGMKWNGTSDGAAQTHFQNGLNGSFGTGAEVGMKLHF